MLILGWWVLLITGGDEYVQAPNKIWEIFKKRRENYFKDVFLNSENFQNAGVNFSKWVNLSGRVCISSNFVPKAKENHKNRFPNFSKNQK